MRKHSVPQPPREREFIAAVFERMNVGVLVADATGRITLFNRAARQLHGLPNDGAVSDEAAGLYRLYESDATTPLEAGRDPLHRALAGEEVQNVEMVIRPLHGPPCIVLASGGPLRGEAGAIVGAFVVQHDITQRNQDEAALQRRTDALARSNIELERFAYVASHDLQEPLRIVANYTGLFASRYANAIDERAQRYLQYINDGVLRMQQLITDLLALSRAASTPVRCEPVDTGAALDSALSNLRTAVAGSGAVVEYRALPMVAGDAEQLTQLFQQLLSNALKYHSAAPPRIQVTAQPQDGAWLFQVQDNGIGIDPAETRLIFDAFRRLHGSSEYPGTGMGLAICKKIVERHGGRIWAESQPGEGASFFFTLPATSSP